MSGVSTEVTVELRECWVVQTGLVEWKEQRSKIKVRGFPEEQLEGGGQPGGRVSWKLKAGGAHLREGGPGVLGVRERPLEEKDCRQLL